MLKMRKTAMNNKKGYILRLRQSRTFKGISMTLVLSLIFEMIQPSVSMALTEGPSQPEVQSFEPIGTTQMVDLFTGDFNYNIPLFNLPGPNGGYPVNIAYHAGISMDDEASWVGLGWNLNVGSLVRNMRGLPDEFLSKVDLSAIVEDDANITNARSDYDHLKVTSDMKKSWTLGVTGGVHNELVGGNTTGDLSLSTSIYRNNFRGWGVTLEPTFGIGKNDHFALGLSIDSENGLGVNASIGHCMDNERTNAENTHKFGINFSGDISLSYGLRQNGTKFNKDQSSARVINGAQMSQSLSFARANFSPSVGRRVDHYNFSGSIALGNSPISFLQGQASLGFNFSTEDLSSYDKNGRIVPVVGFDRQGEEELWSKPYYSRDFSREKEGQITRQSIMLASVHSMYDTYTSTGQGLAGYFRPHRNDIGYYNDAFVYNTSVGASIGYDSGLGTSVEAGLTQVGINAGWNYNYTWNENNPLNDDFLAPTPNNGIKENLYYKAHGESTISLDSDLSYLGGTKLSRVKMIDKSLDNLSGGQRKIDPAVGFDNDGHDQEDRVARNTLIHELKNGEVGHLGEFKIKYFHSADNLYSAPVHSLNRTTRNGVNIGEHKAGFKVLNEQGSYYVYGLPAYNIKEVDNLFSVADPDLSISGDQEFSALGSPIDGNVDYKVSKTHKFINKTEKSPYAHSFLLSSVQGADYVDLTNDGPTDDDLGYWVKFDYIQQSEDYKWRTPYQDNRAQYDEGENFQDDDDKGSYKYGEKELWYLGRMETKSHIAIFVSDQNRIDNREAAGELGDGSAIGTDHGRYLKEIRIYEKKSFLAAANPQTLVPLQTVHFTYNYGLCKEVLNSASNSGKLTLESIHFTSMGSTRGASSKYKFDYASVDYNGVNRNPDYDANSYDSWGTYRPKKNLGTGLDRSYDYDKHFPYTNQFNQGGMWEEVHDYNTGLDDVVETKNMADAYASAWCLDKITLPSGGEINIQYESDDYGYVQHKAANQMFRIFKIGDVPSGSASQSESRSSHEVYLKKYKKSNGNNESSPYYDESSRDDEVRRRIYFALEEPIYSGTPNQLAKTVYEKYVEPMIVDEGGQRNLYFKSRMELTKGKIKDYISGYLPLEEPRYTQTNSSDAEQYNYGVSADGNLGFVTIKAAQKKKKENGSVTYFDKYHPMALAAWTYLQTNAQQVLNNPNSFDDGNLNNTNFFGQVVDLVNVIPQLMTSLGGIRSYCEGKNMARYIDLDRSCIRLASPDKKKFGGGHRVKEISITDNWASDTDNGVTSEDSRTYGQHYEYTIEEDGDIISSGVAQYEPQAGGDENALKYPIFFQGKMNTFSRNNLFAEAPVNESLFPGASVGYRQVEVTSLNTNEQREKANSGSGTPRGRTGGMTRHEFYTAKDFPTMFSYSKLSEDLNTKSTFNLPIVIPFVGSIKRNYFHGTQAFLIETNDMHGKPKSVKSYELNGFGLNESPITESEYEYQCVPVTYQGETVLKLDNYVDVIANDGTHEVASEKRMLGVEVDMFTDQRETKNASTSVGVNPSFEAPSFFPAFFLPEFWVTFSNTKSMFRTFVTNKVVHRSGILKKTKSRDLQTVNESEVLAYDEVSGTPLLSKIKNEFGDDFFSYNIPAYYHYDRMGHAYKNINYVFTGTPSSLVMENPGANRSTAYLELPASENMKTHLVRGDELLIYSEQSGVTNLNRKGYFLGWAYNGSTTLAKIQVLDFHDDGIESYGFRVIRSGRRNHYGSMAANYLTKDRLSNNFAGTENNVGPAANEQQSLQKLNNVLSATASLFKDDWGTTSSVDLNFDGITKNPFLSGNSGIWRPFKSYTYVGERKGYSSNLGNNTSDDPKLYEDGVMDGVPMFSWDLGNMEEYDLNWEWVNEVTRFSPDAYEVENVNRLGIYSSALYGYDNSLSIAVGGNASTHELGAFDFETSENEPIDPVTGLVVSHLGKLLSQTNMNFDNNRLDNLTHVIMTEQYQITSAAMGANNVMTIITDIDPLGINLGNFVEGGRVGLTLRSRKTLTSTNSAQSRMNEGFYFNGEVTGASIDAENRVVFTVKPFIEKVGEPLNVVEDGTKYVGKITLFTERPIVLSGNAPTINEAEYVSGIAHTGNKSMLIKGGTTPLFDQPQLKLIKNKQYVYSMWVRKENNTRVPTYEPGKHGNSSTPLVELGVMSNGALNVSNGHITINKTTYSKIIEGWQKVDIEFKANVDNAVLGILFQAFSAVDGFYVDDIRFSPKTGGITTYVYDPNRFWLRASLNVDNYATFFYYDEEGNLTLKEQETEEGIFTITESRGHVSEQ